MYGTTAHLSTRNIFASLDGPRLRAVCVVAAVDGDLIATARVSLTRRGCNLSLAARMKWVAVFPDKFAHFHLCNEFKLKPESIFGKSFNLFCKTGKHRRLKLKTKTFK